MVWMAAGPSFAGASEAPAKRAWVKRISTVYEGPRAGAEPSDRGKALATLYRGDFVYVLEGDPWPTKVKTAEGVVGYLVPSDEETVTWQDISPEVAAMRKEVQAALEALPDPNAFRTIPKWGLKTDCYPLVRKWVCEALDAARRGKNAERVKHLQKALRSIDLE
jgi:hypothetical protein